MDIMSQKATYCQTYPGLLRAYFINRLWEERGFTGCGKNQFPSESCYLSGLKPHPVQGSDRSAEAPAPPKSCTARRLFRTVGSWNGSFCHRHPAPMRTRDFPSPRLLLSLRNNLDWNGHVRPCPQFPLARLFFVSSLRHASTDPVARMGGTGICRCSAREQADAARHWRGLVPLVPRDGPRVV